MIFTFFSKGFPDRQTFYFFIYLFIKFAVLKFSKLMKSRWTKKPIHGVNILRVQNVQVLVAKPCKEFLLQIPNRNGNFLVLQTIGISFSLLIGVTIVMILNKKNYLFNFSNTSISWLLIHNWIIRFWGMVQYWKQLAGWDDLITT